MGFAPPNVASATTTWPVQSPVSPRFVEALGDDSLSIMDCGVSYDEGRPGKPGQAFVIDGVVKASSTYSYGSSTYVPWLSKCTPAATVTTVNGTLYAGIYKGGSTGTNAVVKEKNGRFIWDTPLQVCPGSTNNKFGEVAAMEMGADGLLYVIFTPNDTACPNRLAMLNPTTGSVINSRELSSGSGYFAPQIWVYAD